MDELRGIAVVLMISWHCTDGWLADAHRVGLGWNVTRVAGGLAAPLFLFAAGMTVALGARRGRSIGRAVTRGLELLVLGHALRLATWALDDYAIASLEAWPALVLGGGLVTLALFALRRSARALVPFTGLLAGAHLAAVVALGPGVTASLLRFDILHCIGVSVITCTLLAAMAERWCPPWGPSAVMTATGVGLVGASTLLVAVLEGTGGELAWLARGRTLQSVAPFPLVPWCGYAILGCGVALAPFAWTRLRPEHLLFMFVASLGAATVTFEGGLPVTRGLLAELPSVRPLARLAFSAGAAGALASVLRGARGRTTGVLETLGRASLPVYALHLQLAYGTLARPLVHALAPGACASLLVLVVAVSIFGGRWLERRRVDRKRAWAFAPARGSSSNSRA